MEELALIFIRQTPGIISEITQTGSEPVLKGIITTPLGKLDGISQSQLEVLRIPYISETGRVGNILMKRVYLDQVLDNLTVELQVQRTALLDNSREIVVVVKLGTSLMNECLPCYYGTTGNPTNMENLQRLESNVLRCLEEGLDYLPTDILFKWKNSVLLPIFEQARTVISEEE